MAEEPAEDGAETKSAKKPKKGKAAKAEAKAAPLAEHKVVLCIFDSKLTDVCQAYWRSVKPALQFVSSKIGAILDRCALFLRWWV